MKRVWLLSILWAVMLAGCSHSECGRCREQRVSDGRGDAVQENGIACAAAKAAPSPARPRSLIFDRYPGAYSASEFTWRSDWPSVNSYQPYGQLVYYREHFHDHQGSAFGHNDSTYRHFDTYRSGVGTR